MKKERSKYIDSQQCKCANLSCVKVINTISVLLLTVHLET